MESKETESIFALVIKKEVIPTIKIPKKIRPLSKEFK